MLSAPKSQQLRGKQTCCEISCTALEADRHSALTTGSSYPLESDVEQFMPYLEPVPSVQQLKDC